MDGGPPLRRRPCLAEAVLYRRWWPRRGARVGVRGDGGERQARTPAAGASAATAAGWAAAGVGPAAAAAACAVAPPAPSGAGGARPRAGGPPARRPLGGRRGRRARRGNCGARRGVRCGSGHPTAVVPTGPARRCRGRSRLDESGRRGTRVGAPVGWPPNGVESVCPRGYHTVSPPVGGGHPMQGSRVHADCGWWWPGFFLEDRLRGGFPGIAVLADLGTRADRRIGPGGGVKGAQMWAARGALA